VGFWANVITQWAGLLGPIHKKCFVTSNCNWAFIREGIGGRHLRETAL